MKKILIIVAVGIVVLAGLVLSYLAFLTDVFNAPLTSEQIMDKIVYVEDRENNLSSLLDDGETLGRYECDYAIIDSYSEYKKLLKKLDTEYGQYVKSELNLDWSFFNKYSLVLISDEGAYKVLQVYTENEEFTIEFDWDIQFDEKQVVAFTVSKKTLRNTDDIKTVYRRTGIFYKPIIYLYPETETDVTVKLGFKDKIIVSYPEYVDGWSVIAKPDGKLVYNETGRNLYSLYYESKNVVDFKVEKDGFIVKKEDIAEFLEEKLAILGLNEYEAEEFIIYWLPILQQSEYSYIRFATADEIERNMPLEINPNPDTIIRVLMTFKGLDEPIEVEEQKLTTPARTGFVAVEWGGTPCAD